MHCRPTETAVRLHGRVVNGPTSSGPTRPEPENITPNPKTNLNPKLGPKNPKVKLGLKNLAMLPSYADHVFVHLRQKARLPPELSPNFLSTLGPNPGRTRPKPEPYPKSPAQLKTLLHGDCVEN